VFINPFSSLLISSNGRGIGIGNYSGDNRTTFHEQVDYNSLKDRPEFEKKNQINNQSVEQHMMNHIEITYQMKVIEH